MSDKPEKPGKEEANKPWMIRDVPQEIRQAVKIYAVEHNMTIAEALTQIVRQQLTSDWIRQMASKPSVPTPAENVNMQGFDLELLEARTSLEGIRLQLDTLDAGLARFGALRGEPQATKASSENEDTEEKPDK